MKQFIMVYQLRKKNSYHSVIRLIVKVASSTNLSKVKIDLLGIMYNKWKHVKSKIIYMDSVEHCTLYNVH